MSYRLLLDDKIQIVLLYAKSESFVSVRGERKNHFASNPPSRPTIRNIFNKCKETGNVDERDRS